MVDDLKVGDRVRLVGRHYKKWYEVLGGFEATVTLVPNDGNCEVTADSGVVFKVYEGWEVEKVEDVMKFEDVRVGDLVKLTNRKNPEVTITDWVRDVDSRRIRMGSSGHRHVNNWSVELLERPKSPYVLPTVPGLYTPAPGGGLESYKVVKFTGDRWLVDGENWGEDKLKAYGWTLRRLVVEGVDK